MKKNISFAVLLLIISAFIVLGSLGYLGSFTAGQIILIGFMALWLFEGLKNMWFGGIIIPLGILYINFYEMIGLPFIGKGATIAIMLCVSLAFDIIFDSLRKKIMKKSSISFTFENGKHHHKHAAQKALIGETVDAASFYEYVKFSSKAKYIRSEDFKEGKAVVNLGNLELYLDKVNVPDNTCMIDVNVNMGNLELYIPETWVVEEKLSLTMANIEDENGGTKFATSDATPVTLTLTGSCRMGNISIIRV